eukprot:839109-Prymnesium_polylepis.1
MTPEYQLPSPPSERVYCVVTRVPTARRAPSAELQGSILESPGQCAGARANLRHWHVQLWIMTMTNRDSAPPRPPFRVSVSARPLNF